MTISVLTQSLRLYILNLFIIYNGVHLNELGVKLFFNMIQNFQ
jgi:hypothetical protein